ncbi:nucleotidyltransferase family protein [Methylomonas sp. HYX-M1]|uniref:nucleotidyltransferase domain-containing protein n=1 Tax=Methylomonas sp. HYX-M1 TaxID=3139307 RepID=UPI00345C0A11
MSVKWPLLVAILRHEKSFSDLSNADWSLLISQAKRSLLLGKLYYLLEAQNSLIDLPDGPYTHFETARVRAEKQRRDLGWELTKLKQAFSETNCPVILLKGAAYAAANLSISYGRTFSDIDLLVPASELSKIESRLIIHGWLHQSKDQYDDMYYRKWMHELPPFKHAKRGSIIDLHHNILPITALNCPKAGSLLESIVELENDHSIFTLSRLDQIIHSATHLFYDGELEHGLRDLVDLQGLINELDENAKLHLADRALQLGLHKPVFYAVRYLELILNTPNLESLRQKLEQNGARIRSLNIMDFLFSKAFMPDHPSCDSRWTGLARWILYVRAHCLRMPWHLLLPHLTKKLLKRLSKTNSS